MSNKLRVIAGTGTGSTELDRVKNERDYYRDIIEKSGLMGFEALKRERDELLLQVNKLTTDKAVLEERVDGMNRTYKLAVENEVNKQVATFKTTLNSYKAKAEEYRKEASHAKSGLAGVQGKVKAAQEREQTQYDRAERLELTNKELRTMIDSINITLANTKEMLIKQEANNKILLENNRMLKKQIEALEQQKELLEKILDSQNNISDKVDNIKNTSNKSGSTDSGKMFKSDEVAVKIVSALIEEIKLPLVGKYKTGTKELAIKYGYSDTASFSNMKNKYKKNGLYGLLEEYTIRGIQMFEDDKLKSKYLNIDLDYIKKILIGLE